MRPDLRFATRRRSPLLPLAACVVAASLLACSDDAVGLAAAGETEGAAYVLRRVDGGPLPARVHVSAEGYSELLADTVRFAAGGVAHTSGAVRSVITLPGYSRDTVFTDVRTRRWTQEGSHVRLTPGGLCDEGDALILCVPPDTGAVRGDSLILALQMPGAPRRAYVRVP